MTDPSLLPGPIRFVERIDWERIFIEYTKTAYMFDTELPARILSKCSYSVDEIAAIREALPPRLTEKIR
jgi:hypothetical protein